MKFFKLNWFNFKQYRVPVIYFLEFQFVHSEKNTHLIQQDLILYRHHFLDLDLIICLDSDPECRGMVWIQIRKRHSRFYLGH